MNGISWRIEMKMKLKAEGRARNGMKIRAKPGERKIKLLPFLFTPFLDSSLLRHPNKENQNFMERGRWESSSSSSPFNPVPRKKKMASSIRATWQNRSTFNIVVTGSKLISTWIARITFDQRTSERVGGEGENKWKKINDSRLRHLCEPTSE